MDAGQRREALGWLLLRRGVREGVILSTCNRTEVYVAAAHALAGVHGAEGLLRRAADGEAWDARSIYTFSGDEAARHLFTVCAGLDSLVIGENQVLGQARRAYLEAREAGFARGALAKLFEHAIEAARRVRRETGIGRGAASISYAAVELAKRIFGDLAGREAMVVGAGKMGALAAKNLRAQGVKRLYVANRTLQAAEALAGELDAVPVGLERIEELLAGVDIAIASTGAPGWLVDLELARRVLPRRRGRPLFLIDVAVPRDVDPAVQDLEGVFVYNVDDLADVVEGNLKERERQVRRAEEIVKEEAERFAARRREDQVAPAVVRLRDLAEQIRAEEVGKAMRRRLAGLGPEEREAVEALTQSIVKKLLHYPTVQMKALAEKGEAQRALALASLLGAEPEEERAGGQRRAGGLP